MLGTSTLFCMSCSPDVKALEELFVGTTLDLLSSLPVLSAKMQFAHCYTQKTKHSLTTAVLRPLVPKTVTVPQANLLVQLGITTAVLRALVPKTVTVTQANLLVQLCISYQTLQDIRCASSQPTSSAGHQLPDTPGHSLCLKPTY